jgi:hypothetical protein
MQQAESSLQAVYRHIPERLAAEITGVDRSAYLASGEDPAGARQAGLLGDSETFFSAAGGVDGVSRIGAADRVRKRGEHHVDNFILLKIKRRVA